jgi:hypothetical protein
VKIDCRVRNTVAAVLTLGLLFAGCGSEDNKQSTAKDLSAKQMADMLLQRCLVAAKPAPDAQSRQQLEAACRASVADVPTGPGAPSSEDLRGAGKSSSTTTPSKPATVEASTIAVPSGGPKKISRFPIPRSAKMIDLGPAFNQNWQFGISSPDPATTIAFYKAALTKQGYTVKENAALTNNPNNIEYDLAFFGKTYGVVDEIGPDGTQITVTDRPIDGLKP